jgi:hypothetical protein
MELKKTDHWYYIRLLREGKGRPGIVGKRILPSAPQTELQTTSNLLLNMTLPHVM